MSPSKELAVHQADHLLDACAELAEGALPVQQLVLLPEKLVVNLPHLGAPFVQNLLLLEPQVVHLGRIGLALRTQHFGYLQLVVPALLKSIADAHALLGEVL
jgi:hypothetical protein